MFPDRPKRINNNQLNDDDGYDMTESGITETEKIISKVLAETGFDIPRLFVIICVVCFALLLFNFVSILHFFFWKYSVDIFCFFFFNFHHLLRNLSSVFVRFNSRVIFLVVVEKKYFLSIKWMNVINAKKYSLWINSDRA